MNRLFVLTFFLIFSGTIAPNAMSESHQSWTVLLNKYVHESDDGINRVDYLQWHRSDADREALRKYIADLAAGDVFQTGSKDERFAAWANLYNAITVEIIIDNYPVKSIKNIGGHIFSRGPWNRKLVTVRGDRLSLNDIEHKILRKKWNDPRVHYAVNCASIGCPNLQKVAWEPESLNTDLNNAAQEFISHPRGVKIMQDGNLKVSRIFKWFEKDFGGSQVGTVMHFMKFAGPELASSLSAETMIDSYQYDWALNDVQR